MNAPLFPISPLLPQIQQHLAAAAAGAGSPARRRQDHPGAAGAAGRTVAAGRKIILLEPRRVAARSAALFMARQLGEEVGGTVGYRIRFENKVSARTRIEVVTEGILTRMLQDDPMLEEVGAILFDEFHERHLSGDLGLALALDVQAQLRDDLRLVVMSATLDGERLARFLDAPR
jgi:ATP-dependent helicase HrpB